MDERRGAYHFEELTTEEKRRVITALSRGLLSEDEKKELAEACRQSRLTEEERKQLTRAFTLSRMTDEERAALIERKRRQKQAAQTTLPQTEVKALAEQKPVQRIEKLDAATETVQLTHEVSEGGTRAAAEEKKETGCIIPFLQMD